MKRVDNVTDDIQFVSRNLKPRLKYINQDTSNILSRDIQQVVVTLKYVLLITRLQNKVTDCEKDSDIKTCIQTRNDYR